MMAMVTATARSHSMLRQILHMSVLPMFSVYRNVAAAISKLGISRRR
jgi:hypothetical protein